MFIFPVVRIPPELTQLLSSELSQGQYTYRSVSSQIYKSKSLTLLVAQMFKDYGEQSNIESIVKRLGWRHFRDRLTSVYVYKALYNQFPQESDIRLVEDLQSFETRFFDYGVDSNSRIFLFGLYLKLAQIELERRGENYKLLDLPESIEEILELGGASNHNLDWLILITWHMIESLGKKVLKEQIQTDSNFHSIFGLLTPEHRKSIINNLISYGCSIHEPDNFIYEKVE